ncbi:MAG: hypothetical protein VKM01_05305, partial [Cyanobacteriota bacterium]|nr:hypothetical protein [Cyanobacteriota bacterium]
MAVDLTATGSGAGHLLRFDQGQTPTLAVQLAPLAGDDPVASLATRAQQALITFNGRGAAGDSLVLALLNQAPHADSQFVETTLTEADLRDPSGLRDRVLAIINATPGLTQGEGAEIGSVAFLTAVASGSDGILLTATTPGVGFGALLGGRSSAGQDLTILPATLTETVANGEAINGLNWLLQPASGGPIPYHGQMLQWSSGLLQQSDGRLVGAEAFLSATGQLLDADGSPITTLNLADGAVLYAEQVQPDGSVSGGYYRQLGAAGPWQAASLAAAIGDRSRWLPGAGPLLETFNPEQNTTVFRLLASAAAPWQLPGASLHPLSAAPVELTLDTPWLRFDPAQAVNATNSSLHLPGLGGSTGELISYFIDPTPTVNDQGQWLMPVASSTAVPGSNRWAGVVLDPGLLSAAPVVDGAPLVAARFFSGKESLGLLASAAPISSIPQLREGQQIHLRPTADNSGVEVFLDAAGRQPLVFDDTSSTSGSRGPEALLLGLPPSQGRHTPVHGLRHGDHLQLISLGNDHYQLAEPGIGFARALPREVLPGQITTDTTLTNANASNGDDQPGVQLAVATAQVTSTSADGVTLNASVDGRNQAYVLSRSERLPTPYTKGDWTETLQDKAKGFFDSTKLWAGKLGSKLTQYLNGKGLGQRAIQNGQATWGVVGAFTVNTANQSASITIRDDAAISTAGDLTINSIVNELYNSAAITELMLESAKLAAGVAIVDNAINSTATNAIGGQISAAGSVNPTAAVVDPSAAWLPLISIADQHSWIKNLKVGVKEGLSDASGVYKNLQNSLFPQLLNSYSNVRNRGHLTELSRVQATVPVEGETDRYGNQLLNKWWEGTRLNSAGEVVETFILREGKGLEMPKEDGVIFQPYWSGNLLGTPTTSNRAVNFAFSITVNAQQHQRTAENHFNGSISANQLNPLSYDLVNSMDLAGIFQFRIGIKNILDQRKGVSAPKAALGATPEMLNYGTIGQKGVGAVVNINTSSHQVSNNFTTGFVGALTDGLTAIAQRGGVELMLSVGSGKSENWGVSGALNVTTTNYKNLSNGVANVIADGATIQAASLSLAAIEGYLAAVPDPTWPLTRSGSPRTKNYGYLKLDVAGDIAYSTSIGVGASVIVNDIQRSATNTVGAINSQGNPFESISLSSQTTGDIIGIAVAGAISDDTRLVSNKGDKLNPKYDDDAGLAGQYAPLYQDLLKRKMAFDGSASVAVQSLALTSSSTIAPAAADGSTGPVQLNADTISLTAEDSTRLVSASGGFSLARRSSTGDPLPPEEQPPIDEPPTEDPQANPPGLGTLAGAASVNLISRQVSSELNTVSLGTTPASVTLTSDTQDALALAGSISLAAGVSKGTTLAIPASVALNLDHASGGSLTSASVYGLNAPALSQLSLSATDAGDALAYAGALGLAANPFKPDETTRKRTSSGSAFGASVAINDL